MFMVLTICTLLLICSCSYSEESDFRIDDFLGRRQLFSFWGSKKSKAAPSKSEIPVDKSISATPPSSSENCQLWFLPEKRKTRCGIIQGGNLLHRDT